MNSICMSAMLRRTGGILLVALVFYGCAGTHPSERPAPEVQPNFEQMFPSWRPGAGWGLEGQPGVYVPSNLYDYIDGQAELYLSYGFQRLVTGSFVTAAAPDEFIVADVYDMGEKLNAFGIYSVYEDEDQIPVDVGASGLRGDRFFAFYKGRYFILITAETGDPAAGEHLARRIAESIPGDTDPPSELRYLPEDDLIQGTLTYIPEGMFGYDFLPRGIEGRYRTAGSPITLFVVLCGSEPKAGTALKRYRAYIQQEGTSLTVVDEPGEEGFSGEEPYHGGLMVIRSGRFLVGARDLSGPSGARVGKERIGEILERILGSSQTPGGHPRQGGIFSFGRDEIAVIHNHAPCGYDRPESVRRFIGGVFLPTSLSECGMRNAECGLKDS